MARGEGLRVRLAPIEGVTGSTVLPDKVYFPAVTGDFEFTETRQHTDYRTIAAGEFSVPSGPGKAARDLRRLSIEVMAPLFRDSTSFMVDNTATFDDVHRKLTDVMRSGDPVDFLASIDLTGRSELACDVTIRSVTRTLRHAQGGFRYFSVDITEWRDTALRRRSTKAAPTSLFAPQLPTKIKLAAADTAESLAHTYYGEAGLSAIILSANGIPKWGRATPIVQAAKFKVGSMFTIPSPAAYLVGGSPITTTTTAAVLTP